MIPPFQTLFSVPLTCESCVRDVSSNLYQLDGVNRVDANLAKQVVTVEGTASPSSIAETIRKTGRDAVLRGSGEPDRAAVCILETHSPRATSGGVRGLVRMVQVSAGTTVFDLMVRGVTPGLLYRATIREHGNLSGGPASTGPVFDAVQAKTEGRPAVVNDGMKNTGARGELGTFKVDGATGEGKMFVDRPVQVWEIVGRGIVVSKLGRQGKGSVGDGGVDDRDDPDILVGVIARSAGVWDNEKTVCSCTGKTLWQERREHVQRAGML